MKIIREPKPTKMEALFANKVETDAEVFKIDRFHKAMSQAKKKPPNIIHKSVFWLGIFIFL